MDYHDYREHSTKLLLDQPSSTQISYFRPQAITYRSTQNNSLKKTTSVRINLVFGAHFVSLSGCTITLDKRNAKNAWLMSKFIFLSFWTKKKGSTSNHHDHENGSTIYVFLDVLVQT